MKNTDDPRYTRAKEKIYEWQQRAAHISKETGIKRNYINEYIGTPDGRQIRGIAPKNNKALKEFEKSTLSNTAQALSNYNVSTVAVEKLAEKLTDVEIYTRLAGGDLTGGSCSSLAFAYAGNLGGYDVLDYRGGGSRKVFASTRNIVEIAKLKNVVSYVESSTNDVKVAMGLLDKITILNKDYYLAAGRHAAIVRKTKDGLQYLEMQSGDPLRNGFHALNESVLKSRFKARTRGQIVDQTVLIDCESLAKNKDFKKLLKYINTNSKAQQKGLAGKMR